MRKFWNLRTIFWLRIIILICGFLVNASLLNHYQNISTDFVQDYMGATSLRRGGSLYGDDISKLENEMLGFSRIPNFHPPFNALLFLPLSFLSYQDAFVFIGILSIFLLLLINVLVVEGLKLSGEWFLNITCVTLYWHPVFFCLMNGQSSMIIAACLIGGWFCLRFEKSYVAGFLFAIATLMKLFPGLLLLYLLMMKNWRTFFAMVFFIISGFTATAFIVGVDNMQTYSISIVTRNVSEFQGFVLNHSIGGLVTRILGERTAWTEPLLQLPRISSLLIVLIDSSVLIYTFLKISKMITNQELSDYAFSLTLIAMLLLSPLTWSHIFPVLILPIVLLLQKDIDGPSSTKLCLILFVIFLLSLPDLLIGRTLMAIYHPFIIPWYSMLLTLGPGVGLLILWFELAGRVSAIKCGSSPN
jgi:hypothetical protein